MTLEEIQEVGSSKFGDYLEVGGEEEGDLGDDSPGSGLGDEVLYCERGALKGRPVGGR